jgi:hypothetical protein
VKLPLVRPKPGVRCDACRRHFEPVPRETTLPGGGAVGSFDCPHCRALYESYRISSTGLTIRREMQAAQQRGDSGAVDRLAKRLKPHVTKARGRVEELEMKVGTLR